MKKIIRLTESDLNRIVKRVVNEQYVESEMFSEIDDWDGEDPNVFQKIFDKAEKMGRNIKDLFKDGKRRFKLKRFGKKVNWPFDFEKKIHRIKCRNGKCMF